MLKERIINNRYLCSMSKMLALFCCLPLTLFSALSTVGNEALPPSAEEKPASNNLHRTVPAPSAQNTKTPAAPSPRPENTMTIFRVVLEPYYRTMLSPVILRPIRQLNYRMGDRFKKDEELVILEDTILLANVEKAKAALEKASAEYESKKKLYDRNISSMFEYKEAEAALNVAKADLVIAQDNLAKAKLIAPYDGRVVELFAEENEYPKENSPIMEIVDDHIIRAKFLLPSRYLRYVTPGEIIDIDIVELGKKVKAKVTRVGAIIDPSSSTIKIEAEIDNTNGELLPGMTGFTTLQSIRGRR